MPQLISTISAVFDVGAFPYRQQRRTRVFSGKAIVAITAPDLASMAGRAFERLKEREDATRACVIADGAIFPSYFADVS
ncbi:MAG: hypothetical protein U0Q11_13935 [Vicinamibacterales bacterium]